VIGYYKQATNVIEFLNFITLQKPTYITTLIIIMSKDSDDELLHNLSPAPPIINDMKKLEVVDANFEDNGDAKMPPTSNETDPTTMKKVENGEIESMNVGASEGTTVPSIKKFEPSYKPNSRWTSSSSDSEPNNSNTINNKPEGYNRLSDSYKMRFDRLERYSSKYSKQKMETTIKFQLSEIEYYGTLEVLLKGRPTDGYMSKLFGRPIQNDEIDRLYADFKEVHYTSGPRNLKRKNDQSNNKSKNKRSKNSKMSTPNNTGQSSKIEIELKTQIDKLNAESLQKIKQDKEKAEEENKQLKAQILMERSKNEEEVKRLKAHIMNSKKSSLIVQAERNIYKRRLGDAMSSRSNYNFKLGNRDQVNISELDIENELKDMGCCGKETLKDKIDIESIF